VYTIGRGLSRLTFQEEEDESPVWTPDGRRVVYSSSHSSKPRTIAWKNADGSGTEEVVLEGAGHFHVGGISPDGQWLIYTDYENTSGSRGDLWVLPLKGDPSTPLGAGKKPQVFLKTQFNEYDPRISPDGKWVAYTSDENGRNEVYVQAFPEPGGKWQISTEGGDSPVWARNGKEIFYRNGSKFYVASVVTAPSFSLSPGRLLFDQHYAENPRREAQYDVFPDGQRFLMLKGDAAAASSQYQVVTNWTEEVKRLAPPGKK
jgi:Tol biopolymer transport system component